MDPIRLHRAPLGLVLIAASIGVWIDRATQLNAGYWLMLAALSGVATLVGHRNSRRSTTYLLLGCLSVGAAWHHTQWSLISVNAISRFATKQPQPCTMRLLAITDVQSRPRRIGRRSWRLQAIAQQLHSDGNWESVNGRLLVDLHGDVAPALKAGSRLQATGQLVAIQRPTNPGGFDYRSHTRSQRVLCRLTVRSPDGFQRIANPATTNPIVAFRRRATQTLHKRFPADTAKLLAAMLLGARGSVPSDRMQPYLETGTIHLFSVSGLHVGIIAGLIWSIAQLLGVRSSTAILWVSGIVVCYALLCEARAPVVRATVLVLTLCGSQLVGRAGIAFNNLAVAGLIVIAWNPAQLFHAGTHLSFLAVAALSWTGGWWLYLAPTDPLDRLVWKTRPLPWRVFRFFAWSLLRCWGTSLLVWLTTALIVVNQFHLVSWIAPWIQPLLWLPLFITMTCGFGTILLDPICPPAASVVAIVCQTSFDLMNQIISCAQQLQGQPVWSSGFNGNWTAFVYLALLPVGWWLWHFQHKRALGALLLTAACVTILAYKPIQRLLTLDDEVRCCVLDVQHGLAVVVELPNGTVMVYDCGSLGSPNRAANTVQSYLWHRGINRLDLLVISHGDADHYNGIPGLLRRTKITRVIVGRGLLERPRLKLVRDSIRSAAIKTQIVTAGDRIDLDSRVTIDVLHPAASFRGESDNAKSIVLLLESGGETLLLTGDLEGSGLDALLRQSPKRINVLLSPHHGAPASNTRQLFQWSRPTLLVVSGRDSARMRQMQARASRFCRVCVTGQRGAVQVALPNTTE